MTDARDAGATDVDARPGDPRIDDTGDPLPTDRRSGTTERR
jgi:hypothetical protein